MTNIIKAILKILLLILAIQIIFAIENVSEAVNWKNIFESGDEFLNEGKNAAEEGKITETLEDGNKVTIGTPSGAAVKETINQIYNILFPLGVAVTVIMGGALGIKFMMASAEDRAKVKESLIPYIIGCIAIYGAFGIWKLVITVMAGVT